MPRCISPSLHHFTVPLHHSTTASLRHSVTLFFLALGILFACVLRSPGADLALKIVDKDPPKELDPAVRALLQNKAVQLLDGETAVYEFWFRTEVPLKSKPASVAKSLDSVKETTLLGAVTLANPRRDYRDDEVGAGVYTMRFAFQPEDGNHLGTAEYPYFAVLVSSKFDTKPEGLTDFKPLVKASERGASADHPMIISLRPASAEDGDAPKLNEPAPEHKSVHLKLPAKTGDDKTSLVFELVYEGKGKK